MAGVKVFPSGNVPGFVPDEFLPPGQDESHIRNMQNTRPSGYWRRLKKREISMLVKNGNVCGNWNNFLVSGFFDPGLLVNNVFSGMVRLGKTENVCLNHHEMNLPAGITNSRIDSCDIGDNTAIHNAGYISHYIIGNNCILFNIDEMNTTCHAKFGNGILKDGEKEDVRVYMDLMNEAGGRGVMPFDGMLTSDAYIWARYRGDSVLQERLKSITNGMFDSRMGWYGTVGDRSVIKSCRIIKDVKFGESSYIKGANKLKNLTINSSDDSITQVGEGVELVNGIIGYGCHVFYGCKAVRFVMCDNSNLKYGARLIHSILGENSTVSCCEILNNLIFPSHEQHHNNSFLIASLVMGQSNIAAGATLGSNHNSRSNDGEIIAGRGFWPGLCVTLKHSSKFASFTLIEKGNYHSELNIPLPFSLVSGGDSSASLQVIPAYWWMYNMYALARNSWKFRTRDHRLRKTQNIEYDYLAPDTIEEIFDAMLLLEKWTARAYLKKEKELIDRPIENLIEDGEFLIVTGRKLLLSETDQTRDLVITGENMERSGRKALILKAYNAYKAYYQMVLYYSIKNIMIYLSENEGLELEDIPGKLDMDLPGDWLNIGGQVMSRPGLEKIIDSIKDSGLNSWESIHKAYDMEWCDYSFRKQAHAWSSLARLLGTREIRGKMWLSLIDRAVEIQEYIRDSVIESRLKDYENDFRKATYDSLEEMHAVTGTLEKNGFIEEVRRETEIFRELADKIKRR